MWKSCSYSLPKYKNHQSIGWWYGGRADYWVEVEPVKIYTTYEHGDLKYCMPTTRCIFLTSVPWIVKAFCQIHMAFWYLTIQKLSKIPKWYMHLDISFPGWSTKSPVVHSRHQSELSKSEPQCPDLLRKRFKLFLIIPPT